MIIRVFNEMFRTLKAETLSKKFKPFRICVVLIFKNQSEDNL